MSAKQLSIGYIYRIAKADAQQLQLIIANHVVEGSAFGGAAQWDFDSKQGDRNLRAIESFTAGAPVSVSGDFGHAFNKDIEVRWKRRDDGDYDLLILSKTEQSIDGAAPLHIGTDQQWHTRSYAEATIMQTDNHPAIRYIDYLAPNGAVQFQRLVEVLP